MKPKFKQTEIGMIPEYWEIKEIQEVSTKLGDGLHGTPKYDDEGEYYFINGNNLVDGKIQFNKNTKKCPKEEFEKNKKDLNERTIFVSINGTLGNIALYNGEKVILGKSVCYFNVRKEFDLLFLKYVLKNNYFQNYILFNATGTTIKNISLKQMREFKFGIPNNFEEQHCIAKILSDLDSKIELNQQMNKTLEAIGQSIFKRWFIDFEFPNEKGKPYKSSGGEMVFNEELGKDIPKGWGVKNIQDFIVFDKGVEPGSKCYETEPSEKNVRFIRVGDINTPGRDQTYIPLDLSNEKFCNESDILLSLDATIGIVRIGMKGVHSSGIRRVFSKEKGLIPKGYIYSLLKSKYIQDTIYTYANGTTIMHAGNSLKHMFLTIPKKDIFQMFAKISEPIFNKIVNNIIETYSLEQIRDSLLPRLMSGKIRVNDINLDRDTVREVTI